MRAIGILRAFAAIAGAISAAALRARRGHKSRSTVILPISGGATYVGQGIG